MTLHSARTSFSLVALALALVSTGSLSGCKKEDTPAATIAYSSAQLVGNWQLDAILRNEKTYMSGTDIKDRYRLTFRIDGTYTQLQLADSTKYEGTWKLTGADNSTLHFTDHKGATHDYTLTVLIPQVQMRYGWNNPSVTGNPLEEFIFSAQR